MSDLDPQLAKRVSDAAQEQSENLDAGTLSQLNQARQKALNEARQEPRGRWLPGGLAAAAAMFAIALGMSQRMPPPAQPLLEQTLPELTVLTSDESLEMLDELEFYAWLDEVLTEGEAG
ncbi:MAG: hypothetical protein AB8B96_10985 [Lysobacterales bacterium]